MTLPYKTSNQGKKQQVTDMFNSIARKYDFLNHFLSFGIDRRWRKKAIDSLKEINPDKILDLACGTGDLTIECLKLNPVKVIGADISEQMLEIARLKIKTRQLEHVVKFTNADSENLPFADNEFDAVSVAFGVRNFENLQTGINEAYRVIRPGGKMVILEFTSPTKPPFKQLYGFYSRYIMPVIGRIISGDKSAYTYLPDSVKEFPQGAEFHKFMKNAGFVSIRQKNLTFGICSIYTGIKKEA